MNQIVATFEPERYPQGDWQAIRPDRLGFWLSSLKPGGNYHLLFHLRPEVRGPPVVVDDLPQHLGIELLDRVDLIQSVPIDLETGAAGLLALDLDYSNTMMVLSAVPSLRPLIRSPSFWSQKLMKRLEATSSDQQAAIASLFEMKGVTSKPGNLRYLEYLARFGLPDPILSRWLRGIWYDGGLMYGIERFYDLRLEIDRSNFLDRVARLGDLDYIYYLIGKRGEFTTDDVKSILLQAVLHNRLDFARDILMTLRDFNPSFRLETADLRLLIIKMLERERDPKIDVTLRRPELIQWLKIALDLGSTAGDVRAAIIDAGDQTLLSIFATPLKHNPSGG